MHGSVDSSGSFIASDVTFMFTWLSQREAARATKAVNRHGPTHYAEVLPAEPPPDPLVRRLFRSACEREAERVAYAVAALGVDVMANASSPIIVSLARVVPRPASC
jgi:hypothetical protein